MTYNAYEYTISVRKEAVDGDYYWVARVEELPDVLEFADSREEAYMAAIDTVEVGQQICLEEGTPFPAPKSFENVEVSGRVTLRLPKPLHAQCIKRAEESGVSLNTLLITDIQKSQTEANLNDKVHVEILALKDLVLHQIDTHVEVISVAPSWSVSRAAKVTTRVVNEDEDESDDFNTESRAISFFSHSRLYHA